MEISDETKEFSWSVLVIGIVVILLFVIGGMIVNDVFLEPYQQEGFSGQVQGLVTEYCTAPRAADKEAARVQLSTLMSGNPSRTAKLSAALQKRATATTGKNSQEACQ